MQTVALVAGNPDHSDSLACFIERILDLQVVQYLTIEDLKANIYDSRKPKPDLVIIDETIHRHLDGTYLARELKDSSDCPPLIGLWGTLEGKDLFKAYEVPYLCVSASNEEFSTAVRQALEK